jgi:UDP-N-acetyl-D-mannosaminuronate dehydrogenase
MRVTIFGSGYVGLVTGACLADAGNHVICVDVDAAKIERLKRGTSRGSMPSSSATRTPGGSSSPPMPQKASSTDCSS